MDEVILYEFPGSLCSQKVRLALVEKQVEYRKHPIDIELRLENYEPWYLRLNPGAVVPTLAHGDRVVTDSARILRYVDESFAGPRLIPETEEARASMEHWIDRQDTLRMRELSYASFRGALGLFLRRVSMPLRAKRLRRLRAHNPDLAEAYDAKIADVRQWRQSIARPAEVRAIRAETARALEDVDKRLGEARYLAGDDYSLADVAWTCVLARLEMSGLAPEFWGRGRLPRLESYYEGLRERPSFSEADVWNAPPTGRARFELVKEMRAARHVRGNQEPPGPLVTRA